MDWIACTARIPGAHQCSRSISRIFRLDQIAMVDRDEHNPGSLMVHLVNGEKFKVSGDDAIRLEIELVSRFGYPDQD